MSKWNIDGYNASLLLDKDILESGYVPLDLQAAQYFDLNTEDGEEKRLIFFYEGREYPSFGESNREPALNLSKALISKLVGVFPDYKEFFEGESQDTPTLNFDKMSSDNYQLKLVLPWNSSIEKKQDFFSFIGTGTGTGNLKDIYDLLFIRELFDNMDNRGYSDVFMVSGKVLKQLQNRNKEAGEIDSQASREIEDINNAGLDTVLTFLMEEQYPLLAQREYLIMEQVGDHFMFRLEPSLFSELSTDDRRFIVKNMDSTIEEYFRRQDAPSLSESLDAFMFDYGTYFNKDFRYSFKDVITDSIPSGLINLGLIDLTRFQVIGYPGKDTWAIIPYISIRDLETSRLNDTGVYIAYILNKDKQVLYLALLIGYRPFEAELKAQGLEGEELEKALSQILRQNAAAYRQNMSFGTFSKDTEKVELPESRYQDGIIAYKAYSKMAPPNETISNDLEELLEIYENALSLDLSSLIVEEEPEEVEVQAETVETEVSEEHSKISDMILLPASEDDYELEETISDIETKPEEEPVEEETVEETEEESLPESAQELPKTVEIILDDDQELTEEDYNEIEDILTEQLAQDDSFGLLGNIINIKRPKRHNTARTMKIHPESIVSQEAIENVRDILSEKSDINTSKRRISLHSVNRTPELIDYLEPEDTSEVMAKLEKSISVNGYTPADNIVKNLYLSLKTYPFTAITGTGGSSLDKFIRLYANALGATFENGRFLQVRAKNTKEIMDKMFGYYNPYNGQFTEGVLTDFILHAVEEPDAPFFIYLKDLPLNKQEDFLGELMTIYDTRRRYGDEVITDPILRIEQFGNDEEALSRYNGLYLPDNLFIIAGLSRDNYSEQELSLLDHISVLDVKVGSLKLEEDQEDIEEILYGSQFLHGDLLSLSENEEEKDMIHDVIVLLEAINSILSRINAQIGPRERDEICLYLLYNAQERLLTQDEALDLAILQKIIPRIYGKGNQVEAVITDLFKICAGTRNAEAVRSYPGQGGLFPNSARKLSQMIEQLDEGEIASVLG